MYSSLSQNIYVQEICHSFLSHEVFWTFSASVQMEWLALLDLNEMAVRVRRLKSR